MIKRKLELLDKCRGFKYQPFVCAINILGYAVTHVGISINSPAAAFSRHSKPDILIVEDEDTYLIIEKSYKAGLVQQNYSYK